MPATLRQSTLETLGLGTVLETFQRGRLPADTASLVDEVFGDASQRGSVVITGANGIVGAGKAMQLCSRLLPHGVRIVGLDFPGAPDGIGRQYDGLLAAFGRAQADAIMANIVRLTYDGKTLPQELASLRPRFLLEAIPEILDIKKAHYDIFQSAFPGIEIRSVTSGFPRRELGVGIAHPAFPHEINKIWEIVEPEPSSITRLLWSLGLIPVPVSDDWSFVLDVLFCGITLAALRYHAATNMPFWRIDKYVRKHVGPNPLRAHDAIGAAGANFLTWSCLHHLSKTYGEIFTPTAELEERRVTGENWYPLNHFRPLVNWPLTGGEEEELRTWILGALFQMTSLMLHENRAHLAHMNAIGELCAQFRKGILAQMRNLGPEESVRLVQAYHKLHPEAAGAAWYPDVFARMHDADWQQLYVNAEHDGTAGVVTLSRESYSWEVDQELNRALDWLKAQGIERVIVTSDFHLSTQMIGADTGDFYPALEDAGRGAEVSRTWSATARRLETEFQVSVGVVNGKRALGGMLELLCHCHYLLCDEGTQLGWPEVNLPVVPGMEACHWPLRKASEADRPRLLRMLLDGAPVRAPDAVGYLVDFAGPLEKVLQKAWQVVTGGDHGLQRRAVEPGAIASIPSEVPDLRAAGSPLAETARRAILACVRESCGVGLGEALEIQARHSADFLASSDCRKGQIGADYSRVMRV